MLSSGGLASRLAGSAASAGEELPFASSHPAPGEVISLSRALSCLWQALKVEIFVTISTLDVITY
jgi:hypothetical protein